MEEHTQPLIFSAKQFLGSCVDAGERAGINYWDMSQVQLKRERETKTRTAADSGLARTQE